MKFLVCARCQSFGFEVNAFAVGVSSASNSCPNASWKFLDLVCEVVALGGFDVHDHVADVVICGEALGSDVDS